MALGFITGGGAGPQCFVSPDITGGGGRVMHGTIGWCGITLVCDHVFRHLSHSSKR